MAIPAGDSDILRKLAGKVAEIGNLAIQRERAELWKRLNRLVRKAKESSG